MVGRFALNIYHLKYALEIAKTGSIKNAAENLYMAQPNLSRAIKELENEGIVLGVNLSFDEINEFTKQFKE